jgi:hypothetical protein
MGRAVQAEADMIGGIRWLLESVENEVSKESEVKVVIKEKDMQAGGFVP